MEVIKGFVRTILFRNERNGFSVLKIKSSETKSLITATGFAPDITVGVAVSVTGDWVTHPKYGKQIQIQTCEINETSGSEALLHYLSGGNFPGIGAKTAEALVEKFGEKLPEIIDKNPERLLGAVKGFTKNKITKFLGVWNIAKETREISLFLYDLGLVGSIAKELLNVYGKSTEIIIRENPYILCNEKFEVPFLKADSIAKKLNIPFCFNARIEAAIIQVLKDAANSGHTYLPEDFLIEKSLFLLGFSFQNEAEFILIQNSIHSLKNSSELVEENSLFYLPKLYEAEMGIADFVKRRIHIRKKNILIDAKNEIEKLEENQGFRFDKKQKEGIFLALQNKITILTGGPGTGKTTMLKGILKAAHMQQEHVVLTAPTGRAAKRMKELCGTEAFTIHRLLSFDPVSETFIKNEINPIAADLVIIDEFSMVDTELCFALFKAIPLKTRVLIVGDKDQLPSVGPGNILRELLNCKDIPSICLEQVFRQSAENDIAEKANKINKGFIPSPLDGRNFHFIPYHTAEQCISLLLELIEITIPKIMQLNPLYDLQILVPMRKGPLGASELNKILQHVLNKNENKISLAGTEWRLNDKIMQLKNNYDKNIFNGDIGFITEIAKEKSSVFAEFDGRTVSFIGEELNEIVLSYASTVHKSQGSEYPAVILILDTSHTRMLRRNLLYTAITRARGHIWILSAEGAFSTAVRNFEDIRRFTKLKDRIENKDYFSSEL